MLKEIQLNNQKEIVTKLAVTTFDHSGYSLKNIKKFTGMEGHGFNATVYKDGKKLGEVRDMADGGPCNFSVDKSFIGKGVGIIRLGDEMMNEVTEIAQKVLPHEFESNGKKFPLTPDWEIFFSKMLGDYDVHKWLKRKCKNNIVLKMKGQSEGEYSTIAIKFTPEVKEQMKKVSYAKDIEQIINEVV